MKEPNPVGRPRKRSGGRYLRLSIYVDDATERTLKLAAAIENKTLTDFVTEAVLTKAGEIERGYRKGDTSSD